MTSTIFKTKKDTDTKAWQAIFPMNPTKNLTESTSFMKKLALVGLSSITLFRDVFPSTSYTISNINDCHVPVIKEDSKCDEANKFVTWIKSSYEPLEKQYLREIILIFYKDKKSPDTIIESYTFSFNYNTDELSINSSAPQKSSIKHKMSTSAKPARDATKNMLSVCLKMLDIRDRLPIQFDMKFKLRYYDSVTPRNYVPEGFTSDIEDCSSEIKASFNLGRIMTPYHTFSLDALLNPQNANNNEEENEIVPSIKYDSDFYNERKKKYLSQLSSNSDGGSVNARNWAETSTNIQYNVIDPGTPKSLDSVLEKKVVCACHKTFTNNYMVKCRVCSLWQHAACFGLLETNVELMENHHCDSCALRDHRLTCSDPLFMHMEFDSKKKRCLQRLTLEYCLRYQEVDTATIAEEFSISIRTATSLMKSMALKGVFRLTAPFDNQDIKKSYLVNTQHLQNNLISKYFVNPSSYLLEKNMQAISINEDSNEQANPNILSQESIKKGFRSLERRQTDFEMNAAADSSVLGEVSSKGDGFEQTNKRSTRKRTPAKRHSLEDETPKVEPKKRKVKFGLLSMNKKKDF